MGVTVRDVAEVANVSATTVSRVFNDSDLVNAQTRERVLAVADRMGYRPNATAQNLSRGSTQTVGVIVPAPHGEFFSEIIRAVDEVARDAGHFLLISSSHYSLDESEAALQSLRGRVDGLLIMETHVNAQKGLLDEYDVPVVFMNSAVQATSYNSFEIENHSGARVATQHLIDQGYRQIGIISGPPDSHDVRERVRGYEAALGAAGIDPDAQLVIEGDFTRRSGYEAGRHLLTLDSLPDAVFACNDYMAIGAMSALQKEGVRIPDDIAIAGFDDIASAEYTTPSLTTVRVPMDDLGRLAAQRLIRMIRGVQAESPLHRTLTSELVVRSST